MGRALATTGTKNLIVDRTKQESSSQSQFGQNPYMDLKAKPSETAINSSFFGILANVPRPETASSSSLVTTKG